MRHLSAAALLLVLAAPAYAQHASPYAGQDTRPIKALSAEETASLLAGRGAGMARAAELNSHPGPMHVLELQDRLALTPAQLAAVKDSQARMGDAARALGADIVERERALDAAFRAGTSPEAMETMTVALGAQYGRLRAVHLAAHIEMRALLTPQQVAAYDKARGYGSAATHRH